MVLIDSYIVASLEEQIVNLGHSSLMLEQSAYTAAFKRVSMAFHFYDPTFKLLILSVLLNPLSPLISAFVEAALTYFFSYGEFILFTLSGSRQERLVLGWGLGGFIIIIISPQEIQHQQQSVTILYFERPPSPKGDLLGSGLFGNHKAVSPHFDGERFLSPFLPFQSLLVPISGKGRVCSVRISGNAAALSLKLSRSPSPFGGSWYTRFPSRTLSSLGAFLQLSSHLSTCGFSHIRYFCGRRTGCACGNVKKCV